METPRNKVIIKVTFKEEPWQRPSFDCRYKKEVSIFKNFRSSNKLEGHDQGLREGYHVVFLL